MANAVTLELPGGVKVLNAVPLDPRTSTDSLTTIANNTTYFLGFAPIYNEEDTLTYKVSGGSASAGWEFEELGSGTDLVTSVNGYTGDVVLTSTDVGLGNVLNEEQVTVSQMAAANGVATLDEDGVIPLEQIPVSLQGGITIIGFWDASANDPDLSSLTLTTGEAYQVYVAGTTSLNGESDWAVYDLAIWSDDITGNWFKLSSSGEVLSVNGATGAVVLDTDDIDEGSTNLYYTEDRVSANTDVAANTEKVSADGSIDTHSDVDISTTVPTSGQALVWDGTNWVPGDVTAVESINDLNDVDTSTTTPTSGQALVWNGDDWIPGDVESNAILTEDIEITGSVGALEEGDTLSAGLTFTDFVYALVHQISYPTYTSPIVSLSLSPSSVIEVGTTQNYTLTPSFTQNDAGDLISVEFFLGSTSGTSLGSQTDLTAITDTRTISLGSNTYSVYICWDDGDVKQDSDENDYTTGQIEAGCSSASKSITGAYKVFYGAFGTTAPTGSSDIRTLSSRYTTATKTFNFTTGTTATYFVIAMPSTYTLSTVTDETSLGADITSNFTLSTTLTSVNDAGGNAIDYNVYIYNPSSAYSSSDTLQVIYS